MKDEKKEHTVERFFHVKIWLQGSGDEPFDPIPLLKLHIEKMEKDGFLGFGQLAKCSYGDVSIINSASFQLTLE